MTTAIPLLPCRKLDDVLPFYESLGFEITTRQERPNPYASTRWRNADLHFYGGDSVGICLFIVDEVEHLHAEFKRIGTWSSNARITRMKPGQSRFTVFDPAGNSVIYIRRGEKNPHEKKALGSPLEKAMRAAEVLRDFKNDDAAAAKVLTQALAKAKDANPDEVKRAKAMLAELR